MEYRITSSHYRVPHQLSSPVDNLLNFMLEFQPANPCKKLTYYNETSGSVKLLEFDRRKNG
jgi:hypothetical protein